MASGVSLAPVITISRSVVAARSLRYPEKEKKDSDQPRVLYRDGINCRAETAVEEFTHLRRKHGHTGETAMRKVPATYTPPDPGEEATHLRKVYPGGRKYWAEPKDGETATHVRREGVAYEPAGRGVATHKRAGKRWLEDPANPTHAAVEGGYVRGSEAINLIYSFDLSSVNPRDTADTERAFRYVRAEIEEKFRATDGGCAVQAKLVAQADAKGMMDQHGTMLTEGGKFHVHAVLNAVQAQDMEIDGETFKAGRKLSAKATDIEWIRDKHDEFARDHPEWGFAPQPKNREERQAEKRSAMDRRMASSGSKSNHDIIRDSYEACMDDARVSDLDNFIEIMREDFRVTVNHRGKKKPTLSYRLDDMPQPVRGQRLGDHYDYENTLSQLEAKASGLPRRRRPQESQQLPVKPDPVLAPTEIDEARRVVADLAYEECLDQWLEDWADERGLDVPRLAWMENFDASNAADRQLLHKWKVKWEAELEALRDTTVPAPKPAKPRSTEQGTKRPDDMTSTPTEDTTRAQPDERAQEAAQRTVRQHREEEERRKAEKQHVEPAERPTPLAASFTAATRQRQERSTTSAHDDPAVGSARAPEPSRIHGTEQKVDVPTTEVPEVVQDTGALDRASQDAEKHVDERSETNTPQQKSARQREMDNLARRMEGFKAKGQHQGENQLE
ncbi:hypothetical protein [Nesterenkonia sp. CF4.4]|uniref:hypothetical protein n=1 Tax=Nesterenkonia sp. CF4.4 TaxID=3373079 RepID=UPI003EE4DE20